MELIKKHETIYERHKKTSMLISIIVLILVTFSFTFSSIKTTTKVIVKKITVNSSNHQTQHFQVSNLTNFHTFFDLYAEVFIPTSNLESIKVESSVELPNKEIFSEKQSVYDVKCPEGVCEPILLVSINPVRTPLPFESRKPRFTSYSVYKFKSIAPDAAQVVTNSSK